MDVVWWCSCRVGGRVRTKKARCGNWVGKEEKTGIRSGHRSPHTENSFPSSKRSTEQILNGRTGKSFWNSQGPLYFTNSKIAKITGLSSSFHSLHVCCWLELTVLVSEMFLCFV